MRHILDNLIYYTGNVHTLGYSRFKTRETVHIVKCMQILYTKFENFNHVFNVGFTALVYTTHQLTSILQGAIVNIKNKIIKKYLTDFE